MDKRLEKKFELKIKVLTHYGKGKCACVRCGFDDIRALSIDHLNGGGREHRRKEGIGSIYTWLWRNEYPEGFQTLCMNCQFVKAYKDDIPRVRGLKSEKLSVRVRTWVSFQKGGFSLHHIRSGLNLTPQESKNLRSYLDTMVRKKELVRNYPGSYTKKIKPVKVFGGFNYHGESKNT